MNHQPNQFEMIQYEGMKLKTGFNSLVMNKPKEVLRTEINTGFHVIKQSLIIQEDPEDTV